MSIFNPFYRVKIYWSQFFYYSSTFSTTTQFAYYSFL